ncbi:venom acid phosphatase Acph-1 [Anabrus simplex]|uniref:venom acid phosphatase Acph-1 n=1 Tax=Anabrus simplex TaxID=316456 RepID=UPI0035A38A87
MRTWSILCVAVLVCRTVLTEEVGTELKLLHVVYRHGLRTPADTYPNDPYLHHDFAPYGWGQLTNEGKMSQFKQGEYLRKRYDKFLGEIYSPDLIEVLTTGVDRTIMSAQLEMAGMWPPSAEQEWNPELRWQPTSIKSIPLNEDRLLLVRIPCPKYYMELEYVRNSSEIQCIIEDMGGSTELFQELSDKTGLKISTPDDILSLYGTLKAEEDFNLTLPEWTKSYYPEKLEPLAKFSFELNAYNEEMKTIKGGPLLKKIIEDSQCKINGENKHKVHMYTGHDSTIANVLITLGVWDSQIPEYDIMVLFELRQDPETNEYGMKIFLRNSTSHDPYSLTVPDCENFCPFSQFVDLVKDVIPEDLDTFCEVDDPNYVPPPPPPP